MTIKRPPVTFHIHHRDMPDGRVEYQLRHGNRIIKRSFDRQVIDDAWPNRFEIAKETA